MLSYIRYCLLFIVTLGFLGCSTAQVNSDRSDEKKGESAERLDNSLLWEISGASLVESSYLFGTIHMINSEDYFLPSGTLSAIDASEKLVFEIDMADMENPLKLMPLLQKAFMKGDTTLKDLMTGEDYNLVKDHFDEMGLPLFLLERIKPMFLTVFASGDFDPTQLQSGQIKSYEMEFAQMARTGGKETDGLETVEFQISVFDDIPYKEQAAMLVEGIKSSDIEDDMFRELIALYKSQDLEALYGLMKEDDSIMDYEDALLNKRNLNWIPIMEQMMKEQRTFFAVGAGHLAGQKGVINLLRNAGYKVEAYSG